MTHAQTIGQIQRQLAAGLTTREALVADALQTASSSKAEFVFTRLYQDAALACARDADRRAKAGALLHLMAGLPVSIKDLFDVEGEVTTAGSRALMTPNQLPATADATAVARLRTCGAAIIGKTNMTEFAFSGVGINPHFGTPRNPAIAGEKACIPGGSSSGAAVSVALGLAVAALGTDTGGSIRIPAALCGLVGFKTTQGRVPTRGARALAPSFDTVCAMTRSVQDCLTVDAVLAGQALPVTPRSVTGLRLLVPQTLLLDDMELSVAIAFERALSTLARAGAVIVEVALPELLQIAKRNPPPGITAMEAYALHQELLNTQAGNIDPRVLTRIKLGKNASETDYLDALKQRQEWIELMQSRLHGFAAMLCPTTVITAPTISGLLNSDEDFFRANGLLLRNTSVGNYLDGCSISLPCNKTSQDEAPVGLMLTSTQFDDLHLAEAALAVEAALNI